MFQFRRYVATIDTGPLLAAGWYALWTSVAFVAAAAVLVSLAPLEGAVHTVRVAPGPTPLRTAGAVAQVPLGYLGVGMARLYLTALPAAFLVAGLLVGTLLDRGGHVAATAAGLAAAATLTVLTGCPCGSGASTPLVLKAL